MSQCIYLNTDGTLQATTQSPSECTGYLLLAREEYSTVINPLLKPLSIEEGAQIALAIGLVWGIAFCIRVINEVLTHGDD